MIMLRAINRTTQADFSSIPCLHFHPCSLFHLFHLFADARLKCHPQVYPLQPVGAAGCGVICVSVFISLYPQVADMHFLT